MPIPDRFDKVIRAILSTSTLSDAARVAGVSERTIRRYRERADFQEQLRAAQRDALSLTLARAEVAGDEGLTVLREIAADMKAPPTARVAAAKALDSRRWKAAEIGHLSDDLRQIRAALEERKMLNE